MHFTIPVILSNGIILPFEKFLNWKSFTIKMNTNNISTSDMSFFENLHIFRNNLYLLNGNNNSIYNNDEIHKNIKNRHNNADKIIDINKNSYIYKKIKNVYYASEWFHWDMTKKKNIWKLLILEIFCKSKRGKDMIRICSRKPTSAISNSEYW